MKSIPESILAKLAEAYGTTASALTYFQGGHPWSDGILYDYIREGQPSILKVMDVPKAEVEGKKRCVSARLAFVRFLGQRNIPIVYPELTEDGELEVTEVDDTHAFLAYSYRKREGVHVFELPINEHEDIFVRWGEAMGRMHALAGEYPIWRQLSEDPEDRKVLGWESEWEGFFEWCKDEEVKASWRKLRIQLDALPITRASFGFTHNDLHLHNLLVHDGELTVLDFDVANLHWFACDIATAIHSIFTYAANGALEKTPDDPEKTRQLTRAFLRGYEQAQQLDAFWLDHLELFLQYRRTLLFIVFAEDLQTRDPEHYASWRKRILENAPFPAFR